MKFHLIISLLLLFCISCQNRSGSPQDSTIRSQEKRGIPRTMASIFEAHGGLDRWDQMNNSVFVIERDSAKETHTVDLPKRKILIEAPAYNLGFDGNNVWLEDKENTFKGDPVFYYNYMFYLSVIPMVFSDPGVVYTERNDVVIKGKKFGVMHIGFLRNVGDSPLDEYMIYYDKNSHKMEWLGYTETYYDRKRSNDWNFINYNSWQEINGLLLPYKITWYNKKDGKPSTQSKSVTFSDYSISETVLPPDIFEAPEDSELVKYK